MESPKKSVPQLPPSVFPLLPLQDLRGIHPTQFLGPTGIPSHLVVDSSRVSNVACATKVPTLGNAKVRNVHFQTWIRTCLGP